MITKIKSIGNLAVFKDFVWDQAVLDDSGNVRQFKDINILYGRNYSGKTCLSRIFRAFETGSLSEKFENPAFTVTFKDNSELDQGNLNLRGKKIRVFNEDFVRENLRFITNPDESIEPFAILGDDNTKIEKEIEALGFELRGWIVEVDNMAQIKSELYQEIERKFRSLDIRIPFPQHDLHVNVIGKSVSAASGKSSLSGFST
jgi:wobble nucleotide-excising tRNase